MPSRKCLHVLRKICGARQVLPTSYDVSGTLSVSSKTSIAHGGFGDAYKGTLSTEVCIKKVRVYSSGDQDAIKEVPHVWSPVGLSLLTNFEAVLQGGCRMETPGSSKYCGLQGYDIGSPSARLGMDPRWRAAGLYKGEPECKSH